MLGNGLVKTFAQQQATWTRGPSLPNHIPEATARTYSMSVAVFFIQDGVSTY
jgi:hypothetical protein